MKALILVLPLSTLWPSTNDGIPFSRSTNNGELSITYREKWIPTVLMRLDLFPQVRSDLDFAWATISMLSNAAYKSDMENAALRLAVSSYQSNAFDLKAQMDKMFWTGAWTAGGMVAAVVGVGCVLASIFVPSDNRTLVGVLAGSGLAVGGGIIIIRMAIVEKKR